MKTVQQICASLIGYIEGKGNNTTFGKWYGLNFNPWCDMAVSKIFFDAGRIGEIAPKNRPKGFASCDEHLKYLAKNGQLVSITNAKADDLVFFQFDKDFEPEHVGIIKKNDTVKKILYVYEGNTSSGVKGSQANGDGFYLKKRDYGLVMAVARPKVLNKSK